MPSLVKVSVSLYVVKEELSVSLHMLREGLGVSLLKEVGVSPHVMGEEPDVFLVTVVELSRDMHMVLERM